MRTKRDFWKLFMISRWRLQNRVKEEFIKINWRNFPKEYTTRKFDEIHSSLITKWNKIVNKVRTSNDYWTDGKETFSIDGALIRLKGAFYEASFYFTWLKISALCKAGKIDSIMSGMESHEPDRFEILPIFPPFPLMFYDRGERIAPQIDADFVLLYSSGEEMEVHRPIFIDVKSSEPSASKRLRWQAIACAYMDSLMQVVWPLKDRPKEIKDWEFRNICYKCGNLSKKYDRCDECGAELTWIVRPPK